MTVVRRTLDRFQANPSSIRHAAVAIISVIATIAVAGAVVVRVFDHEEYPTMGRALWYVLQTVTTVGYGDVTPTSAIGRTMGAIVMLCAIGLLTVMSASITSVFIEAARRARVATEQAAESDVLVRIEATLAAIDARLDRLESAMAGRGVTPDAP